MLKIYLYLKIYLPSSCFRPLQNQEVQFGVVPKDSNACSYPCPDDAPLKPGSYRRLPRRKLTAQHKILSTTRGNTGTSRNLECGTLKRKFTLSKPLILITVQS